MSDRKTLSIIIPVYNEADNLNTLYGRLQSVLSGLDMETNIVFVDDGSTDGSLAIIKEFVSQDNRISYLELSRNFGKEVATTAGLRHSQDDAVLMLDADLQHPVEIIPKFIERWKQGAEVVIGLRTGNQDEGILRRWAGRTFYWMLNTVSDTPVRPNATDFRLLDRVVVNEFNRFTERNRMTRALIDWLGFRREYLEFVAPARQAGQSKYSTWRLFRLALSGFVSHSLFPLRLAGYLGLIIVLVSGPLGLFIFLSKYVLNDPWNMNFSGPAILAVILLFLVGIILSCLGLIALYVANIHSEVANRPLYAVRSQSGLRKETD